MGYDPLDLVGRVKDLLRQSPGRTLTSIAAQLRTDRHTIARALRRLDSISYKELQAEYIAAAFRRLQLGPRPLLRKEVAVALGCSLRQLRGRRAHLSVSDQSRRVGT